MDVLVNIANHIANTRQCNHSLTLTSLSMVKVNIDHIFTQTIDTGLSHLGMKMLTSHRNTEHGRFKDCTIDTLQC